MSRKKIHHLVREGDGIVYCGDESSDIREWNPFRANCESCLAARRSELAARAREHSEQVAALKEKTWGDDGELICDVCAKPIPRGTGVHIAGIGWTHNAPCNAADWEPWPPTDFIKKPAHYTYSDIEPWQVIEAWGLDYFLGNVVKYLSRYQRKGKPLEDIEKAIAYLEHKRDMMIRDTP